jgi:hypothetical protein
MVDRALSRQIFDLCQLSRSRYLGRRMILGDKGANDIPPRDLKVSRHVNLLEAHGHLPPMPGNLEKALPYVRVVYRLCPVFDVVGVTPVLTHFLTTILTYFLTQGHFDTPKRIAYTSKKSPFD